MTRDVVVIGSGHNGLVAAALLAGNGSKVLVLEAAAVPGGLCAGYEFGKGFWVPGILQETSAFRKWVVDGLNLGSHGLRFRPHGIPVLVPADRDSYLVIPPREMPAGPGFELEAPADVESFAAWRGFIERVRPVIVQQLDNIPPSLSSSGSSQAWDLLKRGVKIRRLGGADLLELARVIPMSAADWLEDCFESPLLQSALSVPSVFGAFHGPMSAGTAANLLFHECAAETEIEGGPAELVRALVSACESAGVELRCSSPVERIRVVRGGVRGVTLESGEQIDAPLVVSSCDPKRTLLELLPRGILPLKFEEQIRSIRMRGLIAKVHLGLHGFPELQCCQDRQFEALRICGAGIAENEKAFDAVKYRSLSERPLLDVRIPSLTRPELAPEGQHVISIMVHGAPYHLKGGWSVEKREQLGDLVTHLLGRYAPSLGELVSCREVLTPIDLEMKLGLTEGHLCHGEQALDQRLSMRPAPGCAQFSTPVGGLFLAGSGSHPGGGVTGVPGALAARAVLAQS